jgi:squalene-hopene/tetraprenyl-beta-curcumene cyclase
MFRIGLGVLAFLAIVSTSTVQAADSARLPASDAQVYQQTVEKGIDFLIHKGRLEDGSYGKKDIGVTAICATALLRHGRSPDDPDVAKSLKYLEGFKHPDGGIYSPKSPYQNYETSLAIQCFAAANGDGRYKNLLADAEKFIKTIQAGGNPGDYNYGGAGYEPNNKRADLSNTSFLLDALQAAGDGPEDEAVKRALVFVSRCQNLESAYNTTPKAAKVKDGGFYYTPAAGGKSEAGDTSEGGLRSYGSMTYAGLKSMIFAGVKADDPRVKAAVKWIKAHYTLSENPGMPKPAQGLYYYLHTFAKAMDATGLNELEDDKGVKHNWRHDLLTELAKQQHADGSWINTDGRFREGDANLVTAYALLSLSYARSGK